MRWSAAACAAIACVGPAGLAAADEPSGANPSPTWQPKMQLGCAETAIGCFSAPPVEWSALARGENRVVIPAGTFAFMGSLSMGPYVGDPPEGDDYAWSDYTYLVSAGGSYGLWNRAEVSASLVTEVSGNESLFQSLSLSGVYALTPRYAGSVRLSAGPTRGSDGKWLSLALNLDGKAALSNRFTLHGHFGHNLGGLVDGEGFEFRDPAWYAEACTGGDLALYVDRIAGKDAGLVFWLGASVYVPIGGLRESTRLPAAPEMHSTVRAGMLLPLERWDVIETVSIVYREGGDSESSALPVLAGGFDQVLLTVSLRRRHGHRRSRPVPRMLQSEAPIHFAGL